MQFLFLMTFQDGSNIKPSLMISHKITGPDGSFWKSRFWTRNLTWMFNWEVRFEMWLQSVSYTFYWRLKFLSYFWFYFQVLVVLFFLRPTICCTWSSPNYSSYFFLKSNFYLMSHLGFCTKGFMFQSKHLMLNGLYYTNIRKWVYDE